LTGTELPSITCFTCDLNEYGGPQTKQPWDCLTCPDPAMKFNYATARCECPAVTHRQTGNYCVLWADFNAMNRYLSSESTLQITYFDLIEN